MDAESVTIPDPVSAWLASSESQEVFLRWTQDGDNVSGTLRYATLDGENVEVTDGSFTGLVAGGDVTLTVDGFIEGWTPTGTLNDYKLTLPFPDQSGTLTQVDFRRGDVEELVS